MTSGSPLVPTRDLALKMGVLKRAGRIEMEKTNEVVTATGSTMWSVMAMQVERGKYMRKVRLSGMAAKA